ncbi:hypothetical protein P885DRAFT_58385 [Corynascus similis CBS 632.67]
MPLPRSSDISSSTLRWSRLDASLHQLQLPPPPSEEVERYKNRALPPLPPRRNSGISTSSKEMDGTLTSPRPVVSPSEASVDLKFCGEISPGNKHVKMACKTNLHLDKSRNRKVLWVNTADVLRLGSNTLGSQEPRPELSMLEVQLHGEISPLSNDSSDHSIKEPRTAVSDIDGDVEGHESERQSWEWNTRSDKPSQDLYQEAAKKLAEGDFRAAQQAQRIPQVQLAPDQVLRVERASSADYRHFETKQLPPRVIFILLNTIQLITIEPSKPNPPDYNPRLLALKAKTSVSTLVAIKASDLIGAAVNLVNSALGGGEKERRRRRRRQRLKNSIRVLGDGGRVLASG